MRASLHTKKGQNTAEYLIMLTLVAVASIGLFTVFGQTLRQKLAQVTIAMHGGDGAAYTEAGTDKTETAKERALKEVSMKGVDADELKASGSGGN